MFNTQISYFTSSSGSLSDENASKPSQSGSEPSFRLVTFGVFETESTMPIELQNYKMEYNYAKL